MTSYGILISLLFNLVRLRHCYELKSRHLGCKSWSLLGGSDCCQLSFAKVLTFRFELGNPANACFNLAVAIHLLNWVRE